MSVIAVHIKIWCNRFSNFYIDLDFCPTFAIFDEISKISGSNPEIALK